MFQECKNSWTQHEQNKCFSQTSEEVVSNTLDRIVDVKMEAVETANAMSTVFNKQLEVSVVYGLVEGVLLRAAQH